VHFFHRRKSRAHALRGFTLIELMVVVIIIAVAAGMAMPTMARARQERQAFEYAHSVARLVAGAHSRATARGAAHLVWFHSNGTTDRGTFIVFEARQNGQPLSSCKTADFSSIGASPPAGTSNAVLIDAVNLNPTAGATTYNTETDILVNGAAEQSDAFICFAPSGRSFYAAAASNLSTAQPMTSVLEVDVKRMNGTVREGLLRRVIVPSTGTPRLLSAP